MVFEAIGKLKKYLLSEIDKQKQLQAGEGAAQHNAAAQYACGKANAYLDVYRRLVNISES